MSNEPSAALLALIIDDESQIRRLLRFSLEANGYTTHESATAQDGLTQAALLRPDVILLDLGLPDMDGLVVLRRLREWTHTPILVLSVRDADAEKIAALDAGADDYLTKPFSVGELLARLRTAHRHAMPAEQPTVVALGAVSVDLTRRSVIRDGEPIKLTPTEYALLRLLIQHSGRALTHRQILHEVWGPEYVDETHYLRVYMAQLRQKLENDPAHPQFLLTEPGVGYRLDV